MAKGDDVTLSYFDAENTDPGVPWYRTYAVEQTEDRAPEVRIFDLSSRPLTTNEMQAANTALETRQLDELVPITRTAIAVRPEAPQSSSNTVLFGFPLIVELTHPAQAQSLMSRAELYVQTLAGRKRYGKPLSGDFDVNVPGTVKLERIPCDAGSVKPAPGYRELVLRGNPHARTALDDGRFTFVVPVQLGPVPDKTLISEETPLLPSGLHEDSILNLQGDDVLFVGYRYSDDGAGTGAVKWVTAQAAIKGDVFVDVMERRYQHPLPGAHVGEKLYFRVIDATRDLTDNKDEVALQIAGAAGTGTTLRLTETFGHSGVFKGIGQLEFAGRTTNAAPDILPVEYGDTLTVRYASAMLPEPMSRAVTVYRGANGDVLPFTKRFKDEDIAVQTQFTVAESYFELAKKHRTLGQDVLARREIAEGKKLLEEAIRDFPHTETRAQADYLLANLSLEFANDAPDEDAKRSYYNEAITRFSEIVASYPDSPYAPKSQFKKALTFEKMGQIDLACEEYVKLSYRYPDNELVAETIARLGQYFLSKGKEIQDRGGPKATEVEREKNRLQAIEMFKTAAQVFARLSTRFPDHPLSAKTTVLSAQCYMRAEEYDKSIEVFKQVMENKKAEPDLIAQSMYWCGDCYMKKIDFKNAYRMFKKLTWDYPESTWAKYARGRLTEDALSKAELFDQSAN